MSLLLPGRTVRRLTLAGFALTGCAARLAAQATLPTNEQMRHFRAIHEPRLSPDARTVLVNLADSTADGGKTHLWLVDAAGAAPRQLTYSPDADKRGERDAMWMPDGASILFLSHRGEHTALYRLPMNGGEAKAFDLKVVPAVDTSRRFDAIPLEELKKQEAKAAANAAPAQGSETAEKKADSTTSEPLPVDVDGYAIAPDGKTIAVLIHDPQTPGEKRQKEAKADAEWVDHDPHASRLYLLDPTTGKLTNTAAPANVRTVCWSPDSTRLLVISEAPDGVGDLHPANSAALLAVSQPGQVEAVPGLPPTIGAATWSKDGERIVYQAQAMQDAPPGVADLYEYRLATKQIVDRTPRLKGSLAGGGPIALANGDIAQLVESGFDVALARFAAGQDTPQIVRLPVATINEAGTNQKETGWVYLGSDSSHPAALYFASQPASTPRMLPLPSLVPEHLRTIGAKRVHWKSDRFEIEGLLTLPENAATQKVPLVVEVHGGPTGAFHDSFDPFTQFLLGQGWAVLRPNPRGSTGYGTGFAAANKNDLGGGDFRDVMTGVDFVVKTESIDAARMALVGYSYGGEMAGFAESRTDRFKAIVSAAPVIDQFSEYGTEKASMYDRWFYGYPWEHPEDAWRQSPLAGIARAKTPFLLIQGESDTTDPLGQSQEMYRALRQANVPVSLITYPRENHGPLANSMYGGSSTEPWHGFDARQRIVTFLQSHFSSTDPKK